MAAYHSYSGTGSLSGTEPHSGATVLESTARWACVLVIAGLLLALVNDSYRMTFIQRATIVTVGEEEIYAQPDWGALSLVWKLMAYCAWVFVVGAAGLTFMSNSPRFLPSSKMLFYLAMFCCSAYLLIGMTTDPREILTSSMLLFAKLAPGTLLAMGVFFLAANPYTWPRILKGLLIVGGVATLMWLLFALQMERPSRKEAYRWIFEPTIVLEVTALLIFAAGASWQGAKRWLRFVPLVCLALSIVLMQARLLLVVFLLMVAVYGVLLWRGGFADSEARRKIFLLAFGGAIFSILALFVLWPFVQDGLLSDSAQSFWERRFEDTRTRQVAPFFEHATWDKLLFGAGYPGVGEYNAEGADGIDSGFLNTLYVTGLPMMFCFVMLLVVPVVRCLGLRLSVMDAAVVAVAVTWCVRLTSSTVPSFSVQFLVVVLLMGRCAWLVQQWRDGLTDLGEDVA